MKTEIFECVAKTSEIYFNQHGNAKNADIKRLSKFLNSTYVKERWYLIILLSILVSAYVKQDLKHKNKAFENEERRKDEIHREKLKNICKEV